MKPKPIIPKPGQESVWDYPRPPKYEKTNKKIEIFFNGIKIVDSIKSYRVLETTHPPVYYIPPEEIEMNYLKKAHGSSFCEWKGKADYIDVKVKGKLAERSGWYYPNPKLSFWQIRNCIAFYAQRMGGCFIDGEKVTPQPGGFYGGWIDSSIAGPFKGEPNSWGW